MPRLNAHCRIWSVFRRDLDENLTRARDPMDSPSFQRESEILEPMPLESSGNLDLMSRCSPNLDLTWIKSCTVAQVTLFLLWVKYYRKSTAGSCLCQ